jgi:hypothetical protein
VRAYWKTAAGGAIAGTFIAFVATAMSAGLVIDDAAGFTGGRGTLTAGTDAMFLYVLGFGILGGALIAYLTVVLAARRQPDEPRFRPGGIAAVGGVAGAVAAYAVLRAGIGIGGTITNEVITISAFRAIVTFVSAGAVAGAIVAVAADHLSRRAALALEGEAWPQSAAAFVRNSLPAMGIPALALVVIAGTVFGLSQVLLADESSAAFPIAVASVIAVAVLGGGAYLTRPKDGR